MDNNEKTGFRLGIEGWLLLASVVLLVCGLITPVWNGLAWSASSIIWYADVRNWSRVGWFVANLIVVVALFSIIAMRDRK